MSKVQPPPPRGSVGLSERSKVQPPPPGGWIGHPEKSKVQPPLKVPRDPPKAQRVGEKCVCFKGFTSDFYGISTRLEGRFDFLKSPKSKPPLREGRLDFSKSPRSNPPLLEGPLEISNRPRSMGGGPGRRGGWYKVTLVYAAAPAASCRIRQPLVSEVKEAAVIGRCTPKLQLWVVDRSQSRRRL